jgi:hypothetical protein
VRGERERRHSARLLKLVAGGDGHQSDRAFAAAKALIEEEDVCADRFGRAPTNLAALPIQRRITRARIAPASR